jgi:hypothetical protein
MIRQSVRAMCAVAVSILVGTVIPAALLAQSQSGTAPDTSVAEVGTARASGTATMSVGPRALPVGVVVSAAPREVEPQNQNRNLGVGPNLAMIGVGAAAIAVGLLIGGDAGTLIAVGGGVVGLVGLYRFLR